MSENEIKSHTAVALENDPTLPDLPKITAVGHGHWAERILEIAFAEDIKVREDPELADILAAIEDEHAIPPEAILAVAEILSYVYAYEGQEPPDADNPFQLPKYAENSDKSVS